MLDPFQIMYFSAQFTSNWSIDEGHPANSYAFVPRRFYPKTVIVFLTNQMQ